MKKLTEKQLKQIWKKYIDNGFIYRSQSEEHLERILKEGFCPGKDPYAKIRPKLEKLYNLVLNLEKQGYKMVLDWKGVYPSGSKAVKVSRLDLDNLFIDFTTDLEESRRFIKQFKGGAIAGNVLELIKGIKKFDVKLTKPQEKIIMELMTWAKKKIKFKNRLLRVQASSTSLELAKIHTFEHKRYLVSPYGSFEHFKKVVKGQDQGEYMKYLKGRKKAYVRVISKIPAKEIDLIKRLR